MRFNQRKYNWTFRLYATVDAFKHVPRSVPRKDVKVEVYVRRNNTKVQWRFYFTNEKECEEFRVWLNNYLKENIDENGRFIKPYTDTLMLDRNK